MSSDANLRQNQARLADPAAQATGHVAALPSLPRRAVAVPKTVVRFDPHQRVQHVILMTTFIILALTGLPQKFSGLAVSEWWVNALGGLETVRTIHRTAGVIMLADCVYHVSYICYRIGVQGNLGPLRMIPTPQDLADVSRTVRHLLGLSQEKPRYDRFTYVEKFDYWAVFWGIAMIGGSGLVLMFPVQVTDILPGQAITVAIAVHSDEAVLAVGWIAIMHMFNAHLAPGVFPFNPTIFTGRTTAERYADEHPLEWERIVASEGAAQGKTAGEDGPESGRRAPDARGTRGGIQRDPASRGGEGARRC